MSNEAHAGESRTTSPAAATAAARRTASAMESASSTWVTPRSAGPRVARPSPITIAALTRPRAASASASKRWALSRPPAISTIGSSKAARAFSVASTFVPFESL